MYQLYNMLYTTYVYIFFACASRKKQEKFRRSRCTIGRYTVSRTIRWSIRFHVVRYWKSTGSVRARDHTRVCIYTCRVLTVGDAYIRIELESFIYWKSKFVHLSSSCAVSLDRFVAQPCFSSFCLARVRSLHTRSKATLDIWKTMNFRQSWYRTTKRIKRLALAPWLK